MKMSIMVVVVVMKMTLNKQHVHVWISILVTTFNMLIDFNSNFVVIRITELLDSIRH
jgi:hypothetical protein